MIRKQIIWWSSFTFINKYENNPWSLIQQFQFEVKTSNSVGVMGSFILFYYTMKPYLSWHKCHAQKNTYA